MNFERPATMTLLGNAVWLVSNLCRGKAATRKPFSSQFINPLICLLGENNLLKEVYVDILWCLTYLSDGDNDQVELVLKTGVVPRLMEFLEWNSDQLMMMLVIRILGNFISGTESQTQQVLDAGILRHLANFLGTGVSRNVRKEACWLASNIASGTESQISSLIDSSGVLARLIGWAVNGHWNERKEAVWALSNICNSGTPAQIEKLVQAGGVQPLVLILTMENAESSLLQNSLEAIGRVVEAGEEGGLDFAGFVHEFNGVEYIENLQNHPSTIVYQAAVKLLETHFCDEDDDENLAPQINGTTFGFGLSSPKQLFPTEFLNTTTSNNDFSHGPISTLQQTFDFGSRHVSDNCFPV
jgi:hypothetical protein